MVETTIEWTVATGRDGTLYPGYTQNFWIGCTEVGPECDNCYARIYGHRFGIEWGNHPRRRTSEANWRRPLAWNAHAKKLGVRLKVFTNSLADFFDNQVDPEWRDAAWTQIALTQHLDWLILTKRPQNIRKMLPKTGHDMMAGMPWPWPNVWLGTTAGTQKMADAAIPHLLAVPAAVRFLSCEPLLGPIDLRPWLSDDDGCEECDDGSGGSAGHCMRHDIPRDQKCPRRLAVFTTTEGPRDSLGCPEWVGADRAIIDQVICGGESGPNARPMHPDWARSLRDQCGAAGVPYFFKQWGEWAPYDRGHVDSATLATPRSLDDPMQRFGKKAAGAMLDGREWREMPQPRIPTDGR